MPKATRCLYGNGDKAGQSGVINPHQAEDHQKHMEKAVNKLKYKANNEEITEIMESFINEVKSICTNIHTPMAGTDPKKVLHALQPSP